MRIGSHVVSELVQKYLTVDSAHPEKEKKKGGGDKGALESVDFTLTLTGAEGAGSSTRSPSKPAGRCAIVSAARKRGLSLVAAEFSREGSRGGAGAARQWRGFLKCVRLRVERKDFKIKGGGNSASHHLYSWERTSRLIPRPSGKATSPAESCWLERSVVLRESVRGTPPPSRRVTCWTCGECDDTYFNPCRSLRT